MQRPRDRGPACADRHRSAGDVPVSGAPSRRTSPTAGPTRRVKRSSKRPRRPTRTISSSGCPTATRRWSASTGPRPLGRRKAADLHRPGDAPQPADPHPRRGDGLPGHRDGAADPGGAEAARFRAGRPSPSPTGSRRCETRTGSSSSKRRSGGDGHPRGAGGADRASTIACGKSSVRRWPFGASRGDREAVCGAERGQLRRALGPLRGQTGGKVDFFPYLLLSFLLPKNSSLSSVVH